MAAKRKPAKKRAYHHGDLRNALVQASWRLVKRGGLAALTLREVAREVGVTHAAPYHHFPTRTALLDALAEDAFRAFERVSRLAAAKGDNASERMYWLGRAYVDFARAHPEQIQVMFRARNDELDGPPPAELEEIAHRAFAHLLDAVSACQQAGLAPAGDTHELALEAWSAVHGFSKLWVEGALSLMPPYAKNFERMRDATLHGLTEGWRLRAQT